MNKKSEKPWTSVPSLILKNKNSSSGLLTDEELRIRIQFFAVFLIFSVVSSFMTIVNIVTSWRLLMWSTLIFAICNIVNIILSLISRKTEYITRYLFAVEIVVLFTFFLISGEPEGFSAIWIALLPACGLLLYRLTIGSAISFVQFLIIIFFFWTDIGKSLLIYQYTDSFLLRFPFLYAAFLFVGVFFEFLRMVTQKELAETRYKFEQLSKHDPLTGLFNRLGFYSEIEEAIVASKESGCALAIIDFDEFKTINDRFGHLNGDTVLKLSSEAILNLVGDSGSVCRWGGDELAVYFNSINSSEEICNKIIDSVRAIDFHFGDVLYHETASVGLILVNPGTEYSLADLIAVADRNLYESKRNGRNRLSVSTFCEAPSFREANLIDPPGS